MKYDKHTYKLILESAISAGYTFVDYLSVDFSKGKQIILRHDIDYSPEMALEMAIIDASYKISSTFAVLLSSPLYNPFTPQNISFINEIHSLGHNIALHIRCLNEREISQEIEKEMQIMKYIFPYIQPVFIWHNLTKNNLLSHINVPNMVNAYDTKFTQEMHYISDSVLIRHTPEEFLSLMGKYDLIHLLLHPIIWIAERNNMVAMISHTLIRIIRGLDKKFSPNRAWKEKFPNGLPEQILEKIDEIIIEGTPCEMKR